VKRIFRFLIAPVITIVVLVGGIGGLAYYWAISPSNQTYGKILTHGKTKEKLVALTFDDGPNEPWTRQIAATLDRYGVKATFFVVGANVDASPQSVKALVDDGHLVENHSYEHKKRDAVLELHYGEMSKAETSIAKAAGVCPALFRPPNGFHTPWQLHEINVHKMKTVGWNVQPADWENPPPETIVKRVLDGVKPGSIILLHDGNDTNQGVDRQATLDALPGIIEGLQAEGYRFVLVDELLSQGITDEKKLVKAYLPDCPQAEATTQ
jgi:peptidoglycan-N-acetylglucosamine deacetylase